MYVDDAHSTGVVGERGRGTAYQALGRLDQVLMVGSLSKAFSCMGAFVTCSKALKPLLKLKSNTYIFGGPVPPPYLAAICAVCDIVSSRRYDALIERLRSRIRRVVDGVHSIGLALIGGDTPTLAIPIGSIERTLLAGKWLFDRGYYVPSVAYPAVPIHEGLLRIQVNANHTEESIDGLLNALSDLKENLNDFDVRTA
jgi:7-keto-8-aminopelargonate synthetase-like enzyme